MNYIKHLTGFFDKVAKDKVLNPTHVSMYMALFQFWNCNRFKNPISISRDEVMRISKISSKATYHKCLKNLHALGYINYEPSYNPFKGSHVHLFNLSDEMKPLSKNEKKIGSNTEPLFEQVNEQVVNKSYTGNETSTEQALVSYINNTNITKEENISNDLNLSEQAQNFKNEDASFKNSELQEKEKSFAKKEKEEKLFAFADRNAQHLEHSRQIPKLKSPLFEEVKIYFLEQNFPELEAQKFFNYFSSNGWLVGGKTPMVDWQAAAQNWMLNANKFNTNENQNRAKHLNTPSDKNYSEPL